MNYSISIFRFTRETHIVIDTQGHYFLNVDFENNVYSEDQVYDGVLAYVEQNKLKSPFKRGDENARKLFSSLLETQRKLHISTLSSN